MRSRCGGSARLRASCGCDQNAGEIFQLLRHDFRQLRQRAVRGYLDEAFAGGEDHVDVLIRKCAALVVEHDVHLPGAEHGVQLLMVAVFDGDGDVRVSGRKFVQCAVKLAAGVATQIAYAQTELIAVGDLGGIAAHALVVGGQHEALPVEIFTRRGRREAAVPALEKLEAELAFQRLNLLRDRGLGDVVSLCRLGEAVQADDGLKLFQLFKHWLYPPSGACSPRVPSCTGHTARHT